ncbi:alpha/beta hydrolase-fold protein [Alteriqipengyuania flavescens]|uniref:alpha/beta hydrolase n=1 Tax=Alteriqipengyuania flavescens TaxID=3053610 RepID=UPI0025B2CAEE|nr:alpha/beta hydrolase-fold protein [Alteriqipengyuania flavescens]WJY19046.1 alpha/beta hydrolase-fold protein [Alteriqipengyuania flavescens]WJY24986.1 alpha/beta hydrolase-fold protein [Alteriqipengyuania flavescens]
MIGRALALFAAVLLAACASVPAPDDGDLARGGRILGYGPLAVGGLPDQRISIWLPPGYDEGARRYPVLYMWDGQNLFDPASTHYGKAWMAQDVLAGMVARGEAEPHIVVGLWSPPGKDRYRTYQPEAIAELVPEEVATSVRDMAGGPLASDANVAWLADTVKPWVDRSFRTQAAPESTTIVGASMGGVLACYSLIERPDVFGRAGCVSSHFAVAAPGIAARHTPAIVGAWRSYLDHRLALPEGRRIWMDHGTAALDSYYGPYQLGIAAHLDTMAGWTRDKDFTARVYEGAEHDEIAWNARMAEMLAWLWRE